MDLKTILEREDHDVSTNLLGYDFCISSERNVYNAIRNKYKQMAVRAREKFAEMDGQFEDMNDLLDNAPNAFISSIEEALLELLQDLISVDIYTVDKDAVIDMAFNGNYFDEFGEAYGVFSETFSEIISQVEDERLAREMRKQSRPRWQSATIGGNAINAWSNQLDTAAMNAVEGLAHSAFNFVGNMFSQANAKAQVESLFNAAPLRQDLVDSVYTSCFNLHLLLIALVRRHSRIAIEGSVKESDAQKAQAMYHNFISLTLDEEKRQKFVTDIFRLDPYQKEFYYGLIEKYGDSDRNIETFAETFGVNIVEIKNEILSKFVEAHLGETEEDAHTCARRMEQRAEEIGLDLSRVLQAKEIIALRLEVLDLQYRTVDEIVFDTREEADLAKAELARIQKIMEPVQPPTGQSTMGYEADLNERRKQIDACTTAVKDKYLARIDKYLADFDKKFRGAGFFSAGVTREEAGNQKALQYVMSLPTTTYEELDRAREQLAERLPEFGITMEQATAAAEFLAQRERALNTVDGIHFSTREEATFAKQELAEIEALMQNVSAPDSDSLLPYEQELFALKEKLGQFKTPVKQKYIEKVDQYLTKFDATFTRVGFRTYETREEAAAQRCLVLVKKLDPASYEELEEARVKLEGFAPQVGLSYENAEAARQFLRERYAKLNTVDGVVFETKDQADLGRKEYEEISAIMSGVTPPTKESLLSYEKNLLSVREQLSAFETDVKRKYLGTVEGYLAKFDELFRQTGVFSKAETREAAAQEKALKLVKTVAPSTCDYADVDRAHRELEALLPEIGIELSQAFAATQYLEEREKALNTVDGVVFPSREAAALARSEFAEIRDIMQPVAAPTSDSLLDYEQDLLERRSRLEGYQTAVKDKYLALTQKYLQEFDEKFRKVSLLKTAATREEAAKERALKFVKSKTYTTVNDVEAARAELIALLPRLGITAEQAEEAERYLTDTTDKLNGAPTAAKTGFFGRFKK